MNNEEEVLVFKSLSDYNRLKILRMLANSCCELCACNLLEEFIITQPTLSHHMKTLIEAGVVISRKQGSWSYYSLNGNQLEEVITFLKALINTDIEESKR